MIWIVNKGAYDMFENVQKVWQNQNFMLNATEKLKVKLIVESQALAKVTIKRNRQGKRVLITPIH